MWKIYLKCGGGGDDDDDDDNKIQVGQSSFLKIHHSTTI
jgi:hypothetical protein